MNLYFIVADITLSKNSSLKLKKKTEGKTSSSKQRQGWLLKHRKSISIYYVDCVGQTENDMTDSYLL